MVLIHNPSFSDTEQTLKMLFHGKFLITNVESMLYRENVLSESHTLNPNEREYGAFIGLNRIFSSNTLLSFLRKLDVDYLPEYVSLITEAIAHRVFDTKLQILLQITLLENIIGEIGYENIKILKLLSDKYSDFSSSQTLNNLANLGNFPTATVEKNNENIQMKPNLKKKAWDTYFNSRIPIPYDLHKFITKNIYKLVFIFKPNHRWNNK
jgi:hypothetical protein